MPSIREHTKCKLDVFRQYLDIYFDTLTQRFGMDRLDVNLVDGFCGGGAYQDDENVLSGSPLILLKAVEDAETRINAKRTKPFTINASYYFVDAQVHHITRLKSILRDTGYLPKLEGQITFVNGDFESHLPKMVKDIKEKPRVGKSIFLLDQFGYSDVKAASLNSIFDNFSGAEVLLTFGVDGLLNYLHENKINQTVYREFDIKEDFIKKWRERHGSGLTRPLAQRYIMNNLHKAVRAAFMTPFMLHSHGDNREMALIHLSNHQAARNKMLEVYWSKKNKFFHCGKGSTYTMGFDEELLETGGTLFNFDEVAHKQMVHELQNDLPPRIHALIKDGSLPISDLLNEIGNYTAAPNKVMLGVVSSFVSDGDFSILSQDGKARRVSTIPTINDRIILPPQKSFSFGSTSKKPNNSERF